MADPCTIWPRRVAAGAFLVVCFVSPIVAQSSRVTAVLVSASADGSAPGATGHPGSPTDGFWQTAPATSRFLQREPTEGGNPSEGTEFRVAYNATTLFVQVRAFDREPEKIISYLTRRDEDSPCDWIRIFIDSFHDRRTAYEFAVNPSGVKQDRYWFNDTNQDMSWDAVWDVSVSRNGDGWTADFRIPFSQLRFVPAASNTFGFAVVREIARLKETSTWPLLARSDNGYVSSFGELTGLAMAASPKRLELTPYAMTDLTRQPTGDNPLKSSSSLGITAGLDAKLGLTSGLMLTATVNPDFGQVEADPAVVNLSAFETFFTERRPFFVEGSGNFRFDADCYDNCNTLFYSRRIGRPPQGNADLPSGDDVYVDAPARTSILAAAKLTGRVGRYSIGAMQAFTANEYADTLTGTIGSRRTVEPLTSYTVGRGRRDFANQSYVGFMTTVTNRTESIETNFVPESGYAGGVDFDWRPARYYSVNGFWEASRVSGTSDAIADVQQNSRHNFQRPDLTSAEFDPSLTSLGGDSAAIAVQKIGGRHTRFNSSFWFRSPGFETNDLGFLRRADQRSTANWFQIRDETPNRWLRSRYINFNYGASWNFDGDRIESGGNINANFMFANNWRGGGGYALQQLALDDRVTRGGPGVYMEPNQQMWYWLYTDGSRPVQLGYEGGNGADRHGFSFYNVNPNVTLRPVPAVMLAIGFRYSKNVVDSQWVTNVNDGNDHYVFGRLDQTTTSLTARLNYTMTPTLSLQLYAEPFVSAGDYTSFKEVVDGRSRDYASRYAPYAYSTSLYGDPNFNAKSFRTTNVFRWEYKPGSTLFVVWQQARQNDVVPGGFRFNRDAREIFGVPPYNVFMVKFAYWLNY
jgi:hypothetical protein